MPEETFILAFDFYLYTAGKFELHQGVNDFGGSVEDVDQTFVGAELELLAALFVDECRTVHREDALVRGQGDGAADDRAYALYGLDDLFCAFVNQRVIVRFKFDADNGVHILLFYFYLSRSTRPWHSARTSFAIEFDTSA